MKNYLNSIVVAITRVIVCFNFVLPTLLYLLASGHNGYSLDMTVAFLASLVWVAWPSFYALKLGKIRGAVGFVGLLLALSTLPFLIFLVFEVPMVRDNLEIIGRLLV